MVGKDHLYSVPSVKDRVGSTERDGAITVKPGKETLSEGRGEYFSPDSSPLMDGQQFDGKIRFFNNQSLFTYMLYASQSMNGRDFIGIDKQPYGRDFWKKWHTILRSMHEWEEWRKPRKGALQ
jgi:hypothetical protein